MSTPADPASADELLTRLSRNGYLTGHGPEVTTHMACPWCGAAGFAVIKLLEIRDKSGVPYTCAACGRSGAYLVTACPSGSHIEAVQTGGADAPAWMPNPPRRVTL